MALRGSLRSAIERSMGRRSKPGPSDCPGPGFVSPIRAARAFGRMAKHPALPQAPLRKRQRAELGRHVDLQPAADLNSLLRGLRFVISALCGPLDAAVSASVFLDSDLHATALVYALILKDGRRSSLIQVNHADEQVAQVGIIQSDDDHVS